MDQNRRDFLKISATMLGGVSMGLQTDSNAFNLPSDAKDYVKYITPLSGQSGLRFATCLFEANDTPRVGIIQNDGKVIDVITEAKRQGIAPVFSGNSMISLISSGDAGIAQVNALVKNVAPHSPNLLKIDQVKLLSPVPKPERNIYCVGWNYLEHFEEGRDVRADKGVSNIPEHPVFFSKGTHTMNSPFGSIPYDPSFTGTADWEAELAVVIGKRGRNISEESAMDYVFGYSAFNDTTVREVQQKRHGGQWFKGKSLDGYGPMGPWIVTANGVNLDDVRIICRVNGIEKQNASYKQMYFKIPRIIAELSRGLTLEPGDIIATGTPPGVGYSRKPPEFLKPGDIMETEITGVGIIRNTIELES